MFAVCSLSRLISGHRAYDLVWAQIFTQLRILQRSNEQLIAHEKKIVISFSLIQWGLVRRSRLNLVILDIFGSHFSFLLADYGGI